MTACMPTPSGSGHAAAPLNAIVAKVSSQAVWRSSGKGIRIHVSSRSSASSTQMPASMPMGKTREKSPKPFCSASSRTAAYDPAKPIAAMINAPATTTPMSIRCVRVSCIAATRDPSPIPGPAFRTCPCADPEPAGTAWHMPPESGPPGSRRYVLVYYLLAVATEATASLAALRAAFVRSAAEGFFAPA
ncbi:hypothetical protein QFZ68_003999 [Streptomyces sp. V1I6]|nr:hypothetical protein [Streptomyces sp. V1I6]